LLFTLREKAPFHYRLSAADEIHTQQTLEHTPAQRHRTDQVMLPGNVHSRKFGIVAIVLVLLIALVLVFAWRGKKRDMTPKAPLHDAGENLTVVPSTEIQLQSRSQERS